MNRNQISCVELSHEEEDRRAAGCWAVTKLLEENVDANLFILEVDIDV
jgi:hypothetical protein